MWEKPEKIEKVQTNEDSKPTVKPVPADVKPDVMTPTIVKPKSVEPQGKKAEVRTKPCCRPYKNPKLSDFQLKGVKKQQMKKVKNPKG